MIATSGSGWSAMGMASFSNSAALRWAAAAGGGAGVPSGGPCAGWLVAAGLVGGWLLAGWVWEVWLVACATALIVKLRPKTSRIEQIGFINTQGFHSFI